MDDDFNFGWVTGAFTMVIIFLVAWHIEESSCQKQNNVADCEFARTPFLPVVETAPPPG